MLEAVNDRPTTYVRDDTTNVSIYRGHICTVFVCRAPCQNRVGLYEYIGEVAGVASSCNQQELDVFILYRDLSLFTGLYICSVPSLGWSVDGVVGVVEGMST